MKWGFFAFFATLAFILVLVGSMDVVTLFGGSHQVINISSSENDITCTWCHKWVQEDLSSGVWHSGFNCEECHRLTKTAEGRSIIYATHNTTAPYTFKGEEAHAAYTPRCLDCHGGNATYIDDKWQTTYYNDTGVQKNAPVARAFNESPPVYGTDYSAHKKFVTDSLNSTLSVGENEACIACHTNYSVNIAYSYFKNISYTVAVDYSIQSFSYTGTREYNNTFSKRGAKHEFINTSAINCIRCHQNIYDALVNGTPQTGQDYLTHAPIEIHTSGATGTIWDAYNPWPPGGPSYHYRYHYIPAPAANRAAGVNSSYCFECHNVKRYADENTTARDYYDLTNVTDDTNSTVVHAAEALSCQTCHGTGKTKEVINNPDQGGGSGRGHSSGIYHSVVDEVASTYARTFHGDICMGCHEAAVHPSTGAGGACMNCHNDGGPRTVTIESEPSGYATNN